MNHSRLHLMAGLLCVLLLSACSVSRYLPEGEKYFEASTLSFAAEDSLSKQQRKALEATLKPLLRPLPNKKRLGMRHKVWFYHIAGTPRSEKGMRHWIKTKLGEPPVYLSMANPERTSTLLQHNLENQGYFFARVAADTVLKNHAGTWNYQIAAGPRYTLRNITFLPDSSEPGNLVQKVASESLLKSGAPYSFELVKAERERIDAWLKENGFYLFNPDYILMRIDSTVGNHQTDIQVVIKKETPAQALRQYYIHKIFVYPAYEPSLDSIEVDSSYLHNKFFLIDPEQKYKPKVFDRTIFFTPGELYKRNDHNQTLNRLVNVGTFRFVKNRFEELPIRNDSGYLNTYYYLVSSKRRSLRMETTGKTTSANFGGVEFNMNWRNRNTFRSAEQLFLKLYSGFDVQFAGQNKGYNIYRIGTEGGITWPRFIPFKVAPSGAFVPHTKLTVGYEWQKRQRLYTLTTLKTQMGWEWRANLRSEHHLNPFNFTYVNSSGVTQEYLDQIAKDSNLARIIEEQLIIGPSYTYTYTNTLNPRKRNGWFYKGSVDLSGNVLGWLQGANAKEGNVFTLFEVRYSQFVKTEHDIRYYRRLSSQNTDLVWANRIDVGLGVPYGNSLQLPFIKQFFTGGSNSLRAFRVRSVGPGTFRPDVPPGTFLPDLVGDIKLEFNTEIRARLFSIVHGALFVDAGNIWLFNENPLKPGGKFSSSFMQELAIGGGAGLRLDIAGIFMLRFDLGVPMRKPWLPEGSRWVLSQIDLNDRDWRRENLVFNIAVGLPF